MSPIERFGGDVENIARLTDSVCQHTVDQLTSGGRGSVSVRYGPCAARRVKRCIALPRL